MDFYRKIRVRPEKKSQVDDLETLYPHSVMVYGIPPTQDLTIQQFEELAVERVNVLRILEQANSKALRYQSDEWKESIMQELNLQKLKPYVRLIQHGGSTVSTAKRESDLLARQRDYISHYILRMAYARSAELRRWFVAREMELFRLKFSNLNSQDISKYLEINGMDYTPLTEEQISEIKDGLHESTAGNNLIIEKLDFFKVPFTEVLDLVKSRKCYLKDGYAYVSNNDFVSVVATKHENCIINGLNAMQQILPGIESDDRIQKLITNLNTSYTGKDYTLGSAENVPIESLDQLSKKSFPLCMRMCHEELRSKHKLKHQGRMQYGLFLKGVGVTLEDSLRFWREEFTKIMDYETFEKSYAYNIRHNYGKAGSMVNYAPYSCMKIITTGAAKDDCCGCPYKVLDTVALKSRLTNCGLSAMHVQEVVGYASKGHPQIACGRFFDVTMDTQVSEGINNPNQYFELSQRVMAERTSAKGSVMVTPTQRKKITGDLVVMKQPKKGAKAGALDARYDDELWEAVDKIQSELDATQQLKMMADDDFDMSQIPDDFE